MTGLAIAEGRAGDTKIRTIRVPDGGIQPQVAIGRNKVHLVYFNGDPKNGDLFYVWSENQGETSSAPVRVNSQPGSAIASGTIRGGQIALGRDGRVHVAWNGSTIAEPVGPSNPESGRKGHPMLYARMGDDGKHFEPQRNLMSKTFALDGGGSIAADRNGNVYVAWHAGSEGKLPGEAGRRVWVARSTDEGKSFSPERSAWEQPTGACGCCGMGIFSDGRGDLYALYRSATESIHRDIYLLRSGDRARGFSGGLLHRWEINACPMSSMAFVEQGERVYGAWDTGGQIFFADVRKANPSALPVSEPGSKSKHPRLAVNKEGEVLVAWSEGSGWQKGGSLV